MIDAPPQPPDPEIIEGEKICQEMIELAAKLPKPEEGVNKEQMTQFGNNFYLVFLSFFGDKVTSISEKKAISTIDPMAEIYLKRAEDHGEKWQKFLANNAVLVEDIMTVMEEQAIFSQLMDRLAKLENNPKTFALGRRVKKEIDLRGRGVTIWKKLNPLLEQANVAMAKEGIDSKIFK